jgi:hypothetical protein
MPPTVEKTKGVCGWARAHDALRRGCGPHLLLALVQILLPAKLSLAVAAVRMKVAAASTRRRALGCRKSGGGGEDQVGGNKTI